MKLVLIKIDDSKFLFHLKLNVRLRRLTGRWVAGKKSWENRTEGKVEASSWSLAWRKLSRVAALRKTSRPTFAGSNGDS